MKNILEFKKKVCFYKVSLINENNQWRHQSKKWIDDKSRMVFSILSNCVSLDFILKRFLCILKIRICWKRSSLRRFPHHDLFQPQTSRATTSVSRIDIFHNFLLMIRFYEYVSLSNKHIRNTIDYWERYGGAGEGVWV